MKATRPTNFRLPNQTTPQGGFVGNVLSGRSVPGLAQTPQGPSLAAVYDLVLNIWINQISIMSALNAIGNNQSVAMTFNAEAAVLLSTSLQQGVDIDKAYALLSARLKTTN